MQIPSTGLSPRTTLGDFLIPEPLIWPLSGSTHGLLCGKTTGPRERGLAPTVADLEGVEPAPPSGDGLTPSLTVMLANTEF